MSFWFSVVFVWVMMSAIFGLMISLMLLGVHIGGGPPRIEGVLVGAVSFTATAIIGGIFLADKFLK